MQTRPQKILLVEDDAGVRAAVALILADFYVLAANDVSQALQLFTEHPDVSIIVSDLQMPGGSGLDLLQEVRRGSNVPFLLISGTRCPERDETCAFLSKPFAGDQLRKAVVGLLTNEW